MSETMTDEQRAAHVASTEASMRAAGVPTEDHITEDYFAFDVEHKVFLPDGKQYVLYKEFNEGQRKKYLNQTNRDVTVSRVTRDMKVKMAPGDERHVLLKTAITGWHVFKGGQEVPFTPRNLEEFLDKAPPRVIDIIETAVRKANAWLLAEMSVEDIQKEIDSLQEMLEAKQKEEAGKLDSASR